jgi:hypothetical protein
MKTRSQSIKCVDVELKVNPTPSANASGVPSLTSAYGFGSLHPPTSIIDSPQIYEVDIDFDDASAAWRMNKKSTGGGCYKYICEAKTQLGNNCLREPMLGCTYCKTHNKSNTSTSVY